MCAWHRSYRNQLAEEREENLALRGRIADMMGAAARANEWLRKAIRAYEDDPHHEKLKVRVIDYKQRARCYKRMAMPLYPDDDSEWSDDDDIIDPVYKKQLEDEIKAKNTKREEDMRRAQEEREGGVGSSLEVHTS